MEKKRQTERCVEVRSWTDFAPTLPSSPSLLSFFAFLLPVLLPSHHYETDCLRYPAQLDSTRLNSPQLHSTQLNFNSTSTHLEVSSCPTGTTARPNTLQLQQSPQHHSSSPAPRLKPNHSIHIEHALSSNHFHSQLNTYQQAHSLPAATSLRTPRKQQPKEEEELPLR